MTRDPEIMTLDQIRQNLERYIGRRVRVKASKGRRRVVEREGTLEKTYPDLFLVRLGEEQHNRSISFTYADVLTSEVEVSVFNDTGPQRLVFTAS